MEEKNYDDQINQLLKTSHTGEWASQDIARAQVYAILSLRDAVRTLESRISLFKIDDSETVRSYGDHEAHYGVNQPDCVCGNSGWEAVGWLKGLDRS